MSLSFPRTSKVGTRSARAALSRRSGSRRRFGEVKGYTRFVDLSADGLLEVVVQDDTFGSSRGLQVILHYRNDAYHLAGDLMLKPAPPPLALATRVLQIQNKQWGAPCIKDKDLKEEDF